MYTWDVSMATGVEEIDAQHKELLERLNQFAEALSNHHGREETGNMLDFLQFYAQWHFEREERCMEHYQCPVAAANKSAHQEFIKRFDRLYQWYQKSDVDPRLVSETFHELQVWVFRHIKGVDTQLRPCVVHNQNPEQASEPGTN